MTAPVDSNRLRDLDRMSEAIALSSPSGRMSKRARDAAMRRFRAMFPTIEPDAVDPATVARERAATLLRSAATLRDLASRGMCVRSYPRRAAELEAQANAVLSALSQGGAS